jgi:hypothetical protein
MRSSAGRCGGSGGVGSQDGVDRSRRAWWAALSSHQDFDEHIPHTQALGREQDVVSLQRFNRRNEPLQSEPALTSSNRRAAH